MGVPTKVQLIARKNSEQWYVNFPAAVAKAMEFFRGETVEWCIEDKETLVLLRPEAPARKLKKKPISGSSITSSRSSTTAEVHSVKSGAGSGGGSSS